MQKTSLSPDSTPFIARRQHLLTHMRAQGGGVAILPTAPERQRNRDTQYPYRHDSYFYYLSGFGEPEAVVLLISDPTPRQILFCRQKDEDMEIWNGFRYGPEAACTRFGFDEAWPIGELAERLPQLLANQPALWCSLGHEAAWDQTLLTALGTVRANTRAGTTAPTALYDLRTVLDEMRLIKDVFELDIMRKAGRISAAAHCQAMLTARPGYYEYEVEAELLRHFRTHGSQYPAYPSIVAGGANACILHYVENNRVLADGDLLLIDAGCELDGYAADITRTFPVNGRFSGAQRAVYEIVLTAQHAARSSVRPGAHWNAPHEAAVQIITQGLIDLGLLSGSLDDCIKKGDYRRFYMHRTGHWLGMDVHDAGEYKQNGTWRPLQPGMVMTIEPGCYIRPADDIPEAFWNIGIRIEDNALVTPEGCEYFTDDAPRTIDDIEALMRNTPHVST